MTLGLYDLLAAGVPPPAVHSWLAGHVPADSPVDLPPLSSAERRALAEAWWFWARPGQFWTPGPEFITDIEAGRGWGKDYALSETLCEASKSPERWGGYAIVVGPDPTQVKRDCLFGPSGIFAAAARRGRSGNGPGIADRNLVDRWLRFEAPRGGGDAGLTVYWASSYDPKSVHGANVGLVWWDEFGVSYHDRRDEQGNNAWQALLPAVRAGPDPKIIITQTPSKAPEVRALQADAERPECPACRSAATAIGPYLGEKFREPWRLPRSPQRSLHPLLNTRTTEPSRTCPRCGAAVVARVRCVFGDTRDNPSIAARARDDAARELSTGQAWAFLRFAPRGEIDAGGESSLVRDEHVIRVALDQAEGKAGGQVPDPWRRALEGLGARSVVVVVDPAVTAADASDETGLVAACERLVLAPGDAGGTGAGGTGAGAVAAHEAPQVVGLQDASVRPDECRGLAPSVVWAPRAYWLAVLWGASRIVVETNQGGEEVLSAVRDLCGRPPDERAALAWLRAAPAVLVGDDLARTLAAASEARLSTLARRLAASARGIAVESVRRRADKRTRVEWYGRTAAVPPGGQAVACAPWLGGALHWQAALGQVTGYELPREGAPTVSAARERRDRGDALVSAAQVLLGVRETHRGEVVGPPAQGWMGRIAGR